MIDIYVDADACPVKEEIYRVAARFKAMVYVVSNSYFRVPVSDSVQQIVVSDGFDAADDWIAERAHAKSIVITSDIPLAHRALQTKAIVLAPTGKAFDAASIGMKLAVRDLMQDLRSNGDIIGGPKPFSTRDRSAFLSALDTACVKLARG
jgi:uncharacterized protein